MKRIETRCRGCRPRPIRGVREWSSQSKENSHNALWEDGCGATGVEWKGQNDTHGIAGVWYQLAFENMQCDGTAYISSR